MEDHTARCDCGRPIEQIGKPRCWRCKHARRQQKKLTARALNQRRKISSASAKAFKRMVLGDLCSYCLAAPATTVDHIVPVSKGGKSHFENLTGACYDCNQKKGSKSLLTFITQLWSTAA